MGEVKQIKIKNWTYYFYNDMINLKKSKKRVFLKKNHTKTLVFTTLYILQLQLKNWWLWKYLQGKYFVFAG